MPLQAIGPMMKRPASEGYAVGYFESWSLDSLQGVVARRGGGTRTR